MPFRTEAHRFRQRIPWCPRSSPQRGCHWETNIPRTEAQQELHNSNSHFTVCLSITIRKSHATLHTLCVLKTNLIASEPKRHLSKKPVFSQAFDQTQYQLSLNISPQITQYLSHCNKMYLMDPVLIKGKWGDLAWLSHLKSRKRCKRETKSWKQNAKIQWVLQKQNGEVIII